MGGGGKRVSCHEFKKLSLRVHCRSQTLYKEFCHSGDKQTKFTDKVNQCSELVKLIFFYLRSHFASTYPQFNFSLNQSIRDSQLRILAFHVSRKTRQSRFTKQFFSGS